MTRDYLAAARQFERLARIESRSEARELLEQQAKTCLKLAMKHATEINKPHPTVPPPFNFMA